jgi:hypothetical protein
MYKELFDEKHRLISFATSSPKSANSVPSGEYENDILCEDCDNKIIGGFESYADQVLYGGNIPIYTKNFKTPDGLEFSQVDGIDYSKFKLFLLSILWRASISNRPFFRQVSLGPHEEEIRRMILNADAGLPKNFPCILISLRKRKFPKKLIPNPRKVRIDNRIGYNFLIGGILYIFKIIREEKIRWILEATINKNGELKILDATEQQARVMLSKILGIEEQSIDKFLDKLEKSDISNLASN